MCAHVFCWPFQGRLEELELLRLVNDAYTSCVFGWRANLHSIAHLLMNSLSIFVLLAKKNRFERVMLKRQLHNGCTPPEQAEHDRYMYVVLRRPKDEKHKPLNSVQARIQATFQSPADAVSLAASKLSRAASCIKLAACCINLAASTLACCGVRDCGVVLGGCDVATCDDGRGWADGLCCRAPPGFGRPWGASMDRFGGKGPLGTTDCCALLDGCSSLFGKFGASSSSIGARPKVPWKFRSWSGGRFGA